MPIEALTRAWDGTPREQALMATLRKGPNEARCALWSHPLGWELRADVNGELLRPEAYGTEGDVLTNIDGWRRQFEKIGWRRPDAVT
jgi:hypothetical protein